MSQAWYDFAITQGFGVNGEKGVDLGTPFGTPITALYAGVVHMAGRTQWSCGSSGGQVTIVCNIPNVGITTSYYLHLDRVLVAVNDQVRQGQIIGYSGGQTSGGNWPVVNCPQRGIIYSTGPHTEFGFSAPWVAGPGTNINPTFAITQARSGALPVTTPGGATGGSVTGTPLSTGAAAGGAPSYTIDPNALEAGLLRFYNLSSKTRRVISQPKGFDGMCEALDAAEQFADWNWWNPFGSIMADLRPFLLRFFGALVGGIIIATVVREYISTRAAVNPSGMAASGPPLPGTAAPQSNPGAGAADVTSVSTAAADTALADAPAALAL